MVQEDVKYLLPLQYHYGLRLAAAFRSLCLMETEFVQRGIGAWIFGRYGASVLFTSRVV